LVLRTTAAAWAVAALVLGAPAIAMAGATRGGADAGGCAGAYVVAKDAASLARASAAVLCLVNAERIARGLPAVRASSKLAVAAHGHSDDMIASKTLSHTGSDGTDPYQRATRAGYRWRALGEALGWGAARRAMPFKLVATFMRSSEHRSILLDPVYRDLGIGLSLGAPSRKPARGSSTLTLVFGSS
jgi:uncharacterized protein YkwD